MPRCEGSSACRARTDTLERQWQIHARDMLGHFNAHTTAAMNGDTHGRNIDGLILARADIACTHVCNMVCARTRAQTQ